MTSSVGREYDDRDLAALPRVGTVRGFLPGFTSTVALAKPVLIVIGLLLMAACQPISPQTAAETGSQEAMPAATESEEIVPAITLEGDTAEATVATRSLRVRSAPDGEAEVIFGLSEGDVHAVIELSEDGQWVRLAVDGAPGGSGWVAANLVSINGTLPIDGQEPAMSEEAASEDGTAADTAESGEEVSLPEAPEAGFATVVTDGTRLRVREEATTDAEIAGYIYDGETYEILATSDDGLWIQIPGSGTDVTDNPNGGWVTVEFMLIGE